VPEVKSIHVQMFGERDYPLDRAKILPEQIGPLDELLRLARAKNPIATMEDVVRGIWVQGLYTLVNKLEVQQGRLVSLSGRVELPEPKKPEDKSQSKPKGSEPAKVGK